VGYLEEEEEELETKNLCISIVTTSSWFKTSYKEVHQSKRW